MSNVALVLGTLTFILTVIHTAIFKGNFQHNLYFYFFFAFVITILVIAGVIPESNFENLPALIDGIASLFDI